MESMSKLVSGTLDKVDPDPVAKEKVVEKCVKQVGDCGDFPALNEVDATPETGTWDASYYNESEWVDSEDGTSACSLESDASSNAISGNSLASDADSLAPSCEEKIVKKCPSGGSIVTYDQAISKLNDEREYNAAERHRRGKRHQTDAEFDEQDTSTNTAARMAGSAGKAWTDDKHCSYLNSIEDTFVRSLYGQDYRGAEMSDPDHDCVESRPMDPAYLAYHAGVELFTSLQRGCYDQREYYRPHYLFAPSAPAVFASPWIQHFNPRIGPQVIGASGAQDVFAGHTSSTLGFADGINCQGVTEEVVESVVPDVSQVPQGWNIRCQSQLNASTSAPVRSEGSIQAKKRAYNLDPCTDGVYRAKKLKSTQQKLAETDLELEEQFILERLSQRDDGNRTEIWESRWRLNSNLNRPTLEEQCDRNGAQILQDIPRAHPLTDMKQNVGEELFVKKEYCTLIESKECRGVSHTQEDCESPIKQFVGPKDSSEIVHGREICTAEAANVVGNSARKDAVDSGLHNAGSGVNGVGSADPRFAASRLKSALDESSGKCQLGSEYDEHDECNFVGKTNTRACGTFTWGLEGARRPLLSGNAKDLREEDATAKEH